MVQLYLIFLLVGLLSALVLFMVHARSVRNQHRQRDSAHSKLTVELEIHKAQLDANAEPAPVTPQESPTVADELPKETEKLESKPVARLDDGHVHE